MESTLSNLLVLYAASMFLNAGIALSLWLKQKNVLYKKLFLIWMAMVFALLCNGISSNASEWAIIFIGGAGMFAASLAVANLLESLCDLKINWFRYLTIFLVGFFGSLSLYFAFDLNFTITSFPAIFGTAYPLLHAPLKVLLSRKSVSFSLRLLIIFLFLSYVHMMDFPFLRMISGLQLAGFTVAMFIFFAQSILSLAVVVEAVAEEVRLQLEDKVLDRTKELNRKNEKLLELNSEKNSLIAIVAHDLKSPLAIIRGFVELFDRKHLDQKEVGFLNIIEEAVERTLKMISNILDIQKIESEDMNAELRRTEISKPILKLVEEMRATALKKSIKINTEVESKEGIYLRLDLDYFNSAVENLISNAIKFSPSGNSIDVHISKVDDDVRLIVQDYGPGISEEELKLLFKKYQKLTAKPTAGESSTGLGLSIAKKHIEMMGGEVWCESEPSKGSRFILSFPQYEECING